MRTGLVPQFICSRCQHRCGMVPFYREPGFVACSEGCYDLAREQDFQEAFNLRLEESEIIYRVANDTGERHDLDDVIKELNIK